MPQTRAADLTEDHVERYLAGETDELPFHPEDIPLPLFAGRTAAQQYHGRPDMLPFDPRDVPLPLFARATNPQVPNSASASENLDAIRHAANMVRLYKGRYPSGYRFEHPRSYERYLVIAADSPFEKDADKLITSVDKEGHAGPVEGATQQSHGHGGEGITGEPVVNPFLGPENAEPAHIFSTHPEQLSFWSGKVRIPRTAIPNVNNAQIPDVASTGEPTHKKKKRGKRSKKRKAAHKPSEIEVEESNNDRAENKEAKDESHAEKADPEALQDNEIVEPGRLVEPPDIEFIANVIGEMHRQSQRSWRPYHEFWYGHHRRS